MTAFFSSSPCSLSAARTRAAVALAALFSVASCATNQLDAQWSNPSHAPVSMRGAKILVLCESRETVVRQICQDKLAAQLAALGAVPVRATQPVTAGDSGANAVSTARAAGAAAVFFVAVAPDTTQAASNGASFGFGFGGFGGGGFGGIGISAPLGGERRLDFGYAGNGSLTRVDTDALIWTAKTRSYPSQSVELQMESISKALAEGAQKAGHF